MILTRPTSAFSLIAHYLYHSSELEKELVNNPRITSRTVINLLSSSDEKWMEPQSGWTQVVTYRTVDVWW